MTKNRKFLRCVPLIAIFAMAAVSCNSEIHQEAAKKAEARAIEAEKSVAELNGQLKAAIASLAKQDQRINELEKKTKAAPAVVKIEQIMDATSKEPAAKPTAPAEKSAAKVDPSKADAIRVHSLAASAGETQIAREYVEMDPALKACDKDGKLGLTLCVMPKQGEYSSWLPVLVTWNDGAVPTIADARKILACLQKQWTVNSAVNKTEKNAAELVVRSSFTGECIAKPAE